MDTPLDSRHRQIRRWRWVFGKARDMEQLVAICLSSSASVPRAPGCTAGVHHRRLCTRTYALVLGDSDKFRVWFHSNVTRRHNCPALKHDRDCPRHLALFSLPLKLLPCFFVDAIIIELYQNSFIWSINAGRYMKICFTILPYSDRKKKK